MESSPLPPTPTSNVPNFSPVVSDNRKRLSRRQLVGLLAIGLVVVLTTVGLLVHHHSEKSKAVAAAETSSVDIEEHAYEATVSLDGNSFVPGTLTVRPDTEVFFENHAASASVGVVHSKADTLPAPEFQSGQILAGSGYGYVFRKAGTYHFFDASNAAQTLTVVVKS